MTELKIKEKEVVVPGEVLAEGMEYLPSYGTSRKGNAIFATQFGLARVDGKVIKVIKLSGVYIPKVRDVVIGKVSDVLMSGWRVDMNCAYSSVLSVREASSRFIPKEANLREILDIGDLAVVSITQVTSQKLVDVSMRGPGLMKLGPGRVIEVNTHKVPRIIGKQGSMVSMIKKHTDCRIIVGQNGLVWIQGTPEKEKIAVDIIKRIERESHTSGLTEKISNLLEKGEQ